MDIAVFAYLCVLVYTVLFEFISRWWNGRGETRVVASGGSMVEQEEPMQLIVVQQEVPAISNPVPSHHGRSPPSPSDSEWCMPSPGGRHYRQMRCRKTK